jgi:hypothetical protein
VAGRYALADREVPIAGGRRARGPLPVGQCERCGAALAARARADTYKGRVRCSCGKDNHIWFGAVVGNGTVERRHVTLTARQRYEQAHREPDLRHALRHGLCATCGRAVRLDHSRIVYQTDSSESFELSEYFCPVCHVLGDSLRGRLRGHDGKNVVDSVSFRVPPEAMRFER